MNNYEIVKTLVDRKVVDFKKVGEFISEHGSSLAFDDGPNICGTGRGYLHIYKFPGLGGYQLPQESVERLAELSSEMR